MIKPDSWIRKMAAEHKMIEPFADGQVSGGTISFGPSAYGYDIRIADEFKMLKENLSGVMDPKKFNPDNFSDFKGGICTLAPNSFMLARSVEYFRVPRNILVIGFGKSTYARCGIIVNITPFEPEWEGFVTLGISNTSPLPAKIYAGEGIAQVVFLEAKDICEVSYKDKKGKYQQSKEITPAKVS